MMRSYRFVMIPLHISILKSYVTVDACVGHCNVFCKFEKNEKLKLKIEFL